MGKSENQVPKVISNNLISLKTNLQVKKALVPKESIEALSYIPDIELIPVNNLSESKIE